MRTRSAVAISVTLLIAGVAAVSHLHIQESGEARVLRRGEELKLLSTRLGWASRLGTSRCVTPMRKGKLIFDENRPVAVEGVDLPVHISFQYVPPSRVPNGWHSGDWCSSLLDRVFRSAGSTLALTPVDQLLEHPREAGAAAAEAITVVLKKDGLRVENAAVRFQTPAPLQAMRAVSGIVQHSESKPPVIFIGLDGADWRLLDRYMASGLMPNLKMLVEEGRSGVLETEHPPLSPLVWNTMMTGVGPLEHHILDFTRFNPQSRTKEPITTDERRVPAIWNMATYAGKSTAVMGLWATYPAEPVRGLLISDRLFTFLYSEANPPPGIVFPPSREPWARSILQNVEKTSGYPQVREYLPWLQESEYQQSMQSEDPYAHPVSALRRILVETALYHRLAMSYLAEHNPDLTILYLQGTDSIGHVFAPYQPPRQAEVSAEDFERYRGVAERYFHEVDTLLGQYREIASKRHAQLMLASDHGFRWFEGRPTRLSSFAAATAAKWHRNEGIFLLWGAGIRSQPGHVSRGGVAQVAATLAALCGLPPDRRLAGPPLDDVRNTPTAAVDYRQYYIPSAAIAASSAGTQEELAKLRALGYIGSGESTTAPANLADKTRTAGSYNNEGLILRAKKRPEEAINAFETAISIDPNLASALWNLSDMLFEANRNRDKSDQLLVRALANGLPEGVKYVVGRAIGYQRAGEADRSLALLEAAVRTRPEEKELHMFRGRYRIARGNCAGALEDFVAAQRISPDDPIVYASAGIAATCLGDRSAAEQNFRRSLELQPNQPRIRAFLQQLR